MAESQKETTQGPTKDERLVTLETDNVVLKETLAVCLEVLLDAARMGTVRRMHDGTLKIALEKLTPGA